MSSPGFFEFDTTLPNFGEEKSALDDDYDVCNDETFGQAGLGDEAWDEDANADIIHEIEKERIPLEFGADDHATGAARHVEDGETPNLEEDDFEPTYITESIQQMILDDDEDDKLNVVEVPFDDPAIVSVPRSRPVPISEKRALSPSLCLPELDNYGSPYKTSIWAPPAVASSKPTRNERGKLPPGLSGGPQAASDRVTNNKTTGANAAASRPSVQQAPKPQLAPSSRPSPLEDPSVVTALPMSVAQMPQQRQSAHPSASLKIVAQPKTLAELEEEMLSGDQKPMPSPFPEPPSHAQLIHAMQQQQQHMNHPGIRPMMQPGRNPMFSAPPPIYMRFQGPPPGMMPGRGRGMLNTGPVPGQVRAGMPGLPRPVPVDGRVVGPYPGHGPIPAQISLLGPAPGPYGQQHQQQQPQQHPDQLRPREPVDKYAGLMSMKDRTWLVNIQLSQLFTPNPYIDDYYYTMHELKKIKKPFDFAKPMEEENNAMAKAMAEKVVLLGLKESANPTPCSSYAPPVVEKSLGRISVASALAPRKMVNVTTVASRSQHSILLLIENVFPHLLELEDLRRQAGLLEDGEVKQTALSRLSRHMTITNAIASLHDKAVLGAVMAVHKGRRLVERLVSFPALGVAIGPIVAESAMCNLSVSFPFQSKGDRETLLVNLTGLSCVGSFGHEQVAGLLRSFLRDPTLLATVIANATGLSILLAVLHRAALIVEATRLSLASMGQPVTSPAMLAQLKPCEELIDTGKAISRVLLSTSASPAVMIPPGAALRIASVFDLPQNAARDLEARFGSSLPMSKLAQAGRTSQAANVQATSASQLQPSKMNVVDSPLASKNTVLAAFAGKGRPGSSPTHVLSGQQPSLYQQTQHARVLVPGVTPPLIDFGTPGPTPPPSEMDVTPVLVPVKSTSASVGPR